MSGAVGGRGVDAAERVADLRGGRRVDARRRASCAFQTGWSRREIGHREAAGFAVLAEDRGDGRRDDAGGDPHPLDLLAVALDRRPPVGGDLELGQRALDADRPVGSSAR